MMKSRKYFLLVALVALLSCSQEDKITEGSWSDDDGTLLSIQDSLIVFNPVFDGVEKFTRKENDLSIINRKERLKIIPLEDGSARVVLTKPDSSEKVYDFKPLYSLPNKAPSVEVKRIIFSSLGCYGSCPVMNFEIDKDGVCYFEGKKHTFVKGHYQAIGQKNAFNLLESKIRNVDIGKLDSLYAAPWTDDQQYLLKIYYDDKVFETNVYGKDKEPMELRLLLLYLTGLPAHLYLQPSTTPHDFEITKKIPELEKIEFLPPK